MFQFQRAWDRNPMFGVGIRVSALVWQRKDGTTIDGLSDDAIIGWSPLLYGTSPTIDVLARTRALLKMLLSSILPSTPHTANAIDQLLRFHTVASTNKDMEVLGCIKEMLMQAEPGDSPDWSALLAECYG